MYIMFMLYVGVCGAVDIVCGVPTVYNTSASDSLESLGLLDGLVEIYLV